MKLASLALAVTVAVASSGCVTYFTLNKTAPGWKPTAPKLVSWQYAAVLGAELALGTGLGLGIHAQQSRDRDPMNDDTSVGVNIAAGNMLLLAGDAVVALVVLAIAANRDDD